MDKVFEMIPKILPYAVIPVCVGFFLMCGFISWKVYGKKATIWSLSAGAIIAYVLEEVGVHTGWIFGHYYFNPICGPKLDVIPIGWPFGWAGLLFCCWVISNLMFDGSPSPTSHGHARIWTGAALTALLASTIDVSMDPFCSSHGGWVWTDGGPFFGVPYHNWFGWFLVGFLAMLAHGYIFRKEEPTLVVLEEQKTWVRLMSAFPLVVIAFCDLGLMLINYEGILGLTQLYMLFIPMIAAVWQFVKWYKGTV